MRVKVFSDFGDDFGVVLKAVEKKINAYLGNVRAGLVYSIQPQVTEFVITRDDGQIVKMTRYTVTVVMKS